MSQTYVSRSPQCTTPYTVQKGKRPRRRWSPHTASCYCTTYTPSCCWCTRCTWTSERTAYDTVWHCDWLRKERFEVGVRTVCLFIWHTLDINSELCSRIKERDSTWSFTEAAVHRVDAGLSLQPTGRCFSQVTTEASIAGFPRQPLERGVGEWGHVLPAPVRHVYLTKTNPGSHTGLVLVKR